MTNGEKFKEIFGVSQVDEGVLYAFAWLPNHDAAEFSIDWWSAEYKDPITKNDVPDINVGKIDCISRADARSLICEIDLKHNTFGMSRKVFKDLYNGMDELPSVTPSIHNSSERIDKCIDKDLAVDCISRQEAIDTIRQLYLDLATQKAVIDLLKILPSVTPQERKTGKWISTETKGVRYAFWCRYKCSLCGGLSDHTNFCPNCGAKMESEDKEQEDDNT